MLSIYDRKLNYVHSFNYAMSSDLTFDLNNTVLIDFNILVEDDYDFDAEILRGYFVDLNIERFNIFGCIVNYEETSNGVYKISLGINYDALDTEVQLFDIVNSDVNKDFAENEVNHTGTYKPHKGLGGVILLYCKYVLSRIYPFDEMNPSFLIEDHSTNNDKIEDLFLTEDKIQLSELIRIISSKFGLKVSVKFNNILYRNQYHNNERIGEEQRYISIIVEDYNYIAETIDEVANNIILGDLNKSFQSDLSNIVEIYVTHTNDEDKEIEIARGEYVLGNDGIVVNVNDVEEKNIPLELIYSVEHIDYDLDTITEEEMLARAISLIGNNYSNEITFKSTAEKLGLKVNPKSHQYNYLDLLGKPYSFILLNRRMIPTRITSLTIRDDDVLDIRMGGSRRRLTDKLKNALKLKNSLKRKDSKI